ncbi:MBL fold metallo-hydrolase [Candidatus Kaiserbacteria bacterium]|nr:MBL fold metallo-hydrolase [Candidatus Kaiserbacteria bacterium]
MVIQRAGGFCFKISAGATTIALNPPSSRSKHKVSKFGSDIVLVSIPETDWNGVETATHSGKEPFVVSGAGAYEVGDVRISGYSTPASYGDVMSDVGNTIYIIEMDGIRILALGAISSPKLPPEVRSEIDDIGIVLVPVGGGTLGPKEAHELVTGIEPKVIIPYGVGLPGQGKEDDLRAFLKAEGETGVKSQEKFTVRAKELAAMGGDVILLDV